MQAELLAAICGLAGILGGGVLHYILTRFADRRRERREQLLVSYARLTNAIHGLASSQKSGHNVGLAQTEFEIAKAQFVLHGSDKAIKLFSQWLYDFGVFDTVESQKAFAALINQMRLDCSASKSRTHISDKEVFQIMFP